MGKSKGHPEKLAVAERRVVVFNLKKQGGSYRAIASKMWSDYPGKLPKSYDERGVYRDVMVVLDKLNKELKESADVVRRLELERLDLMFRRQFERAVKGDDKAVMSCVRIMDRRSRYLGLDAAVKTELTGKDGAPVKVEMVALGGIDPEEDI